MSEAEDRDTRWLKVSIGLRRFEPHMFPLVQQLGHMDARLVEVDNTWPDRYFGDKLSDEDHTRVHEQLTLSYLWLLGAYEFIRTLCDRIKADDMAKTPEEVREALTNAKLRIARVRMPLAKMEPASKHAGEDGAIAYPLFKRGSGVGWQLNPKTIVTRREPSDVLLESLELRRVAFLRYQAVALRSTDA